MKPSTKAVNWPIEAARSVARTSPGSLREPRKHATAVHGEGGNKVEERQKEVHRGKPVHHSNLHVVDTDSGSGAGAPGQDGHTTVPATFPMFIAQDIWASSRSFRLRLRTGCVRGE
jgi:hypothetical protein